MDELTQIELEYAYTPWEWACRDEAVDASLDLRHCRRPLGHKGECASGYGAKMARWSRVGVRM